MKTRRETVRRGDLKALKAIVIGMGILIAGAICLLAYGLYKKSVDPTWKLFGSPRPVIGEAANTPPAAFGDVSLGLSPGCRIEDISASGPRAFVRIGPDAACDAVIVIDLADGRILGRIAGQ